VAYCLGVALPVFEVCRRRTNFSDIPGYIDDLIIGGLLLFAARGAERGRPHGRALLIAAWGILCGGLWGSLFGQIYNTSPHDFSGIPNMVVVGLKLLVYGVATTGLVLSIRRSEN
jgi:peptidoglycan/LPS O-acetylase OafA/YrhL